MEITVLGGGCFWCLEAVFEQLRGVERVISGYMGGAVADPSYEAVCTGTTGHAEVVQIKFEPQLISYRQLLEIFFATHDPTTLNRQGADSGTQYRSVIFYLSDEQRIAAESVVASLSANETYGAPVVTAIESAATFYPAEDYHQAYFRNNPGQGYCAYVVAPKAAKVRQRFPALLKTLA
jgi:peptide-methionine (S)-S-oxide reductase